MTSSAEVGQLRKTELICLQTDVAFNTNEYIFSRKMFCVLKYLIIHISLNINYFVI